MMLKIAVFAPMPSASVSTAMAAKPGFFSSWRKAKRRSFIAKGLHGIYFRRPVCGQPAGEEGNTGKRQPHGEERHGVVRLDGIQLIFQQASARPRADQTQDRKSTRLNSSHG